MYETRVPHVWGYPFSVILILGRLESQWEDFSSHLLENGRERCNKKDRKRNVPILENLSIKGKDICPETPRFFASFGI